MDALVVQLARGKKGKGKGEPKDEPKDEEEGEDTGSADEAFSDAASRAFKALKDDDEEGFTSAFRDAVEACSYKEE